MIEAAQHEIQVASERGISPASDEYYAAASCHAAEIFLAQGDFASAGRILEGLGVHRERVAPVYQAWSLLLGATSRFCAGDILDAGIDLQQFKTLFRTIPDRYREALLTVSEKGLSTMIERSCDTLALEVLGEMIPVLKSRDERLVPEVYVSCLLNHARLLVRQQRAEQSWEDILACRDALTGISFADFRDEIRVHEQMSDILSSIGMYSEAIRNTDRAIEMSRLYGDDSLEIHNYIVKAKLHYRVGDEVQGAGELAQAEKLLQELLPDGVFMALQRKRPEVLSRIEQRLTVASDQIDYRKNLENLSELLLVRAGEMMDGSDAARATGEIAEQLQVLSTFLSPGAVSPAADMVLMVRALSKALSFDKLDEHERADIEACANRLSPLTPRGAQASYLSAIHHQRLDRVEIAAQHFERAEERLAGMSGRPCTVSEIHLMILKGFYLLEVGEGRQMMETVSRAYSLVEDLGLTVTSQGVALLRLLIAGHEEMGEHSAAHEWKTRLAEVQESLARRAPDTQ